MRLAALIRKGGLAKVANDNPAKVANDGLPMGRPLAGLAALALANPTIPKTVTARGWLLHYPDREPVEVYFSPEVTHAEVLRDFPGTVAAEPIPERTR